MQLSDILLARDRDAFVALLLDTLKGLGHVRHSGTGTGEVAATGVATAAAEVVVQIVAGGEVGVATFKLSIDGGTTWGGTTTTGASHASGVGPVFGFANGPSGAGTSFVAGDEYRFDTWTPTFPVASWQPGSTPRTLVEMDAEALADLDAAIALVAAGGLTSTSTGAWLKLLAKEFYGLDYKPAVVARHNVRLTDAANEGPLSFSAGQLRVSTGALEFVNRVGGTVPLGGNVTVEFEAVAPGSAYNVAVGSITKFSAGALPGVTVTNPDKGDGTSITQSGSDEESDLALRARCQQRWGTLGAGGTEAAYLLWATTADPQVTKVKPTPDGSGNINILIAGDGGALGGAVVTAVQDYLDGLVALTATAVVASAANKAITITGTIKVRAADSSAAQAGAAANIAAYQKELPIGGESGINKVDYERIVSAIAGQTGVVEATFSAPTGDVALASNEVAVFTLNLTWTSV